jgi:hypothetical protein
MRYLLVILILSGCQDFSPISDACTDSVTGTDTVHTDTGSGVDTGADIGVLKTAFCIAQNKCGVECYPPTLSEDQVRDCLKGVSGIYCDVRSGNIIVPAECGGPW